MIINKKTTFGKSDIMKNKTNVDRFFILDTLLS